MSVSPDDQAAIVFEALITPHRSLSTKGIALVAGSLTFLSAAVAFRFLLLGAWPVMVFSLLEVPIVGVLLAINVRRARTTELIMLNQREITVTRTDPAGRRQSFSMPAAWLRVTLENESGGSRLMLNSRGREREVGAFLHDPDKLSLCDALTQAVHDVHHPLFDNPQLR
jgi:uncharacterized membrane protein